MLFTPETQPQRGDMCIKNVGLEDAKVFPFNPTYHTRILKNCPKFSVSQNRKNKVMIIPPNMEHQKLTLRGCLGLIVFTLSLLLGLLESREMLPPRPSPTNRTCDFHRIRLRCSYALTARFTSPSLMRLRCIACAW